VLKFLKRLSGSQAARNAAASYFSFFSVSLWGFLSIPVAVAYLDKEQLGLWAVVNVVLTYLIWLDLGVGSATGRLIAKAVADRDQTEINRWWTATRAILYAQAVLVVLLGLALVPVTVSLISPSEAHRFATVELMIGGVLLTALFFPMRGVPGLLTAQQRFHWVPIISGISPWANLLVFYLLLKAGWGMRAYIAALAVSQTLSWFAYMWVVKLGDDRPQWDRTGITRSRFSALFGYSSKITVVSIVEALVKTLPTVIIARAGGLALVPVYNFASKVPMMGYSLASRSYQSFYPALLRLHVDGKRELFEAKYRQLCHLTLGIGLIGGGMLLAFNRSVINLLAGEGFFPGDYANIWFSVSLITIPLTGLFVVLVVVSGDMRNIAWIYLVKMILAVPGGYIAWKMAGMAGITAFFTLLPLIGAYYGYYHGGRACGTHSMRRTCAMAAGIAMLCGLLIFACGHLAALSAAESMVIRIFERSVTLPGPRGLAFCLLPTLGGAALAAYAFLKLYKGNTKPAAA
jgi:O-antigen/teichoic acid export membrane protein